MGYRIMEVEQRTPDSFDGATEIGKYDSADRAMEVMKRAFVPEGREPPPWYLVDPWGQILMGPYDLYQVAA